MWASGNWFPGGGGETVWLISAVAWWVLSLLSAPRYRPPRDTLGASIGALLTLVTLDLSAAIALKDAVYVARGLAIAYALTVAVAALVAAILEYDGRHERTRRAAFAISDALARGEALFGAPALISIFGFYTDRLTVFVLVTAWFGFAFVKPGELLIRVGLRLRALAANKESSASIGIVRRVDHPNIVRVALTGSAPWQDDSLYVACLPGDRISYVIPLFAQVQENELVGTGFCSGDASGELLAAETGFVFDCGKPELLPDLVKGLCGSEQEAELVGFVVEGSSIGSIRFEVARDRGLEEGIVVFCSLSSGPVFYQILDAQTAEESFRQNPRGTHIVHAVQLGTYDPQLGFRKYSWLPPMNNPVFRLKGDLEAEAQLGRGEFIVGKIPSTNIGLKVSLPEVIEYHTAILGVTGTGKTELALDIVREALRNESKVFCVDLTGEYRSRLADVNPVPMGLTKTEADTLEQKLFDAETGQYGAGAEKKALKTFLDGIKGQIRQRVAEFLEAEGSALAIFELAEVTNTRATLRTTELYLSEIMLWARQNRRARRVLIVLEEAHTIIPETAGAGFDYDSQWVVSRIGQIALQGRKYGVGLLIVSQRTALVSKTILSQCNTYFTHSLVDQTSLGYLANIYSAEHVRAVPNLRFLEFLAFGKAVRSERPMLVRREYDQAKYEASESMNASAGAKTGKGAVTEAAGQ